MPSAPFWTVPDIANACIDYPSGPPEFVKRADIASLANLDAVDDRDFADSYKRSYPCHTAAATWLSALTLAKNASDLGLDYAKRIETRIEAAAAHHGILPAVKAIRYDLDPRVKAAYAEYPDEDFGYVKTAADGSVERLVPIANVEQIKKAAAWLVSRRFEIPFVERRSIADRVLDKCASIGFAPKEAETLERFACRGICSHADLLGAIDARIRRVPADVGESLRKMANEVRDTPRFAMHPDSLADLANVLETVDRSFVEKPAYNSVYEDPLEVCFRITLSQTAKVAADSILLTNGVVLDRSKVDRIDPGLLKTAFGDEFVERVTNALERIDPEKFAAEASIMPADDADTLTRLVAPVMI